jgi:hypothetical protein
MDEVDEFVGERVIGVLEFEVMSDIWCSARRSSEGRYVTMVSRGRPSPRMPMYARKSTVDASAQ